VFSVQCSVLSDIRDAIHKEIARQKVLSMSLASVSGKRLPEIRGNVTKFAPHKDLNLDVIREHDIRDAIHKEIARQKVPKPYTLHPTPYTLHHNIRDALHTENARQKVPTPPRG